ncbi:Rna1 GTPase-activating protein [Candida orthopsilosis Co 90-125]|uniref:Rna1 GTPase-activating protein n=1 Tax=Candida orthopsilosis (strain 90-125) TaxID=1136231 RepID=H8X2H5_CANO9|nr:Rna1 GTPase-activating protein [Candida orthopsilosis Co 90-125]CCG25522.1 Rna1 GTPase-activating protein [Candida orthopsilosis Co 90-125]
MASIDVELGVTPETTYSIAGKQIKFNSEADIEPYIKELNEVKNVTKIDFSGNTIGIEASKALSEALLKHKDTVVEINFSDLYTGRLNTEIPQSLNYLLPALLKFPNLKLINLSDNAFGLQTIDPIEAYIAKAVSLEHLILSNNGMGPFAGSRIGGSLFKLAKAQIAAKKSSSLKTFICGRNRLENGSVNYLAVGLRNHKDLEVVRLYQNGIRPAGISKLVEKGLSHNKKLKVLDLQDNTITTSGAIKLAESITNWPDLVELNLNDSLLKNKGSLEVVRAFGKNKKENLTVLKLQYNELETDSLAVLADLIGEYLPNLKLLELNGNRFEEDSEHIESIKEVFEKRGFGEIDELDELEELDSDEEEEEEEEEEDSLEVDLDLEELEKELAGVKLENKDSAVDDIADELSKAHIE